jgi:hypothetical protein
MTASFGSITGIKERGQGSGQGFPVWDKRGVVSLKKIPGGSKNVIQKISITACRLAMPVRVTAAQLQDLYDAVGSTASLVFHFETVNATLEAIDAPEEFFFSQDTYTTTLHFLRSSTVFAAASTSFLLESGDTLLLESGTELVTE